MGRGVISNAVLKLEGEEECMQGRGCLAKHCRHGWQWRWEHVAGGEPEWSIKQCWRGSRNTHERAAAHGFWEPASASQLRSPAATPHPGIPLRRWQKGCRQRCAPVLPLPLWSPSWLPDLLQPTAAFSPPHPTPNSQATVTDALESCRAGSGTTWKASWGEVGMLERTENHWSVKCPASLEIEELWLQQGTYFSLANEMFHSHTNCPDQQYPNGTAPNHYFIGIICSHLSWANSTENNWFQIIYSSSALF